MPMHTSTSTHEHERTHPFGIEHVRLQAYTYASKRLSVRSKAAGPSSAR